ncbi:hypothetical protein [Gorillibacterium sp. sgz5001074]|uniref:hypothetical protein n=1 Tax=Gorillibacterium sp. sgz5001074 TaxID=3446695 RepID=UPI003F66FD2E
MMVNNWIMEPWNGMLPEPEAVEFIQSFLQTQYRVTMAKAREDLDQAAFEGEVRQLDGFYREGLKSGFVRGKQPGDDGFAEFAEQFHIKAERTCFLIRAYEHAKLGRVYRFYTGTDRKKGKQYYLSYYCANLGDGFRIVGEYLINSAHTAWERQQGEKWADGAFAFTAVWRFHEPENEKDKEDYISDAGRDLKANKTPLPMTVSPKRNSEPETKEMADFIRRFGPIQEDARAQSILQSEGLELLGGSIYTSGFFRNGHSPADTGLPWAQLAEATGFAVELAGILQAGGCTAPDSEGDSPYVPFVYCGEMLLDGLPDFAAKDDVPAGASVVYDTVEERACMFWPDELEEEIREMLDQGDNLQSGQAYRDADHLMRRKLTRTVVFQIERGVNIPWVIGGTFCPGIFAGVVTLCIRT